MAADEYKMRLSVASLSVSDAKVVARTWFEYASFVLRALGDAKGRSSFCTDYLDEARHALDECLTLQPPGTEHVDAMRLRGCIFFEQGRLVEARNALHAILKASLRTEGHVLQYSLDAAILCVILDVQGDGVGAHDAAATAANAVAGDTPGMYKAVAALQGAVEYLQGWSLLNASSRALALVNRATSAASARGNAQGSPSQIPSLLKARRLVLDARFALFDMPARAIDLASLATSTAASATAYEILADAHYHQGRLDKAVDPYAHAIQHRQRCSPCKAVPLGLRVKHARCLLQTHQYDAARDAFLIAANEWQTSSLWLGAGAATLRLGRIAEADVFLRLATVRSARKAPPHAWLALLHATEEDPKDAEIHASKVLDLSMTLGLYDASLLRELGNAYYALERFALAEALFRRAVAAESKRGANTHARKRLADVLAARDATRDAMVLRGA